MRWLAFAPLLVVLVTCVGTLAVPWPRLRRVLSVLGILAYTAAAGALTWWVVFAPEGGAVAYQVGGWPAPHGITLVADGLSVFMLAITGVVASFALVLSVVYVDDENQRVYYHPLYHFLILGATGAFLTGDIFNLFVWFEVMLVVSYAFVAFYGGARHTAAAMRYIVLNTIGGVVMLLAVGGLYATTGTLNMAEMATRLSGSEFSGLEPVVGFAALLLASFALKAGLVPFQFWVPGAYRAAPLPVAATFAGATKKVGIYAILRIYFTVFGGSSVETSVPFLGGDSPLVFIGVVLLVMGCLSIVVGGLGAVSRDYLDGMLAYSSIGQIGFITVPIAIAAMTTSASLRHLGVLAGLVFTLQHALSKVLLFLSAAVIQDAIGTTAFDELGGIGERSPLFAGAFLVGGLSLVGIPPLVGFFGKLFVFDAAATALAEVTATSLTGGLVVVFAILLAGATLTIVYITRALVGNFWGSQTAAVTAADFHTGQIAIVATLALVVVAVGAGFEPIYQFADAAAEAALDTDAYVETVTEGSDATASTGGGH